MLKNQNAEFTDVQFYIRVLSHLFASLLNPNQAKYMILLSPLLFHLVWFGTEHKNKSKSKIN